jgi:hypothetical protein
MGKRRAWDTRTVAGRTGASRAHAEGGEMHRERRDVAYRDPRRLRPPSPRSCERPRPTRRLQRPRMQSSVCPEMCAASLALALPNVVRHNLATG